MTNHAAVLGINYGNVGSLADTASGDAAALGRIGRGEAHVEERIALAVTVQAASPRCMTAFNDVVVARVPGFGTARMRIDTDAVRVTREPSSAPLSIEVDGRRTVEVPPFASLEVRAAPCKARCCARGPYVLRRPRRAA